METPIETKRTKLKTWVYAIFIWVFLCVWLSGTTASLMAAACRNDRYEGSKKLRFCNISITAGAWMSFASIERAKRSIIRLEKGIALSQIGKAEEAVAAFDVALRDSRAKSGPWEQRLHQRMLQLKDAKTLSLWVSVVKAAD